MWERPATAPRGSRLCARDRDGHPTLDGASGLCDLSQGLPHPLRAARQSLLASLSGNGTAQSAAAQSGTPLTVRRGADAGLRVRGLRCSGPDAARSTSEGLRPLLHQAGSETQVAARTPTESNPCGVESSGGGRTELRYGQRSCSDPMGSPIGMVGTPGLPNGYPYQCRCRANRCTSGNPSRSHPKRRMRLSFQHLHQRSVRRKLAALGSDHGIRSGNRHP